MKYKPSRYCRFAGNLLFHHIRRNWLRSRIERLLFPHRWIPGAPVVSQGFAGERLGPPPVVFDKPLISVIMPVYNACRADRRFFSRALESVANQTYRDLELIVVDDGSSDESRQVYEAFIAERPDLRTSYLIKGNGGQSSARNSGIRAAIGAYVCFLDQDDEWYEDKLEKIVPWLNNKDIDMLYTDADIIDSAGNVVECNIHRNLSAGWPHPKRRLEHILYKDIFVMPGVMTIKKETVEKAGGFDENLSGYEDDDLFLRLFQTARIFYLPVSTLRWRLYGDNYSLSTRMLKSRSYYWRKLIDNYTDCGRDLTRSRLISIRFFQQFIDRAYDQYSSGNDLYLKTLDGAREVLPYLPRLERYCFGFIFLFPNPPAMQLLILAGRLRRLAINLRALMTGGRKPDEWARALSLLKKPSET
jgi:glycosyltransferase involved in cell wall biosynthesis